MGEQDICYLLVAVSFSCSSNVLVNLLFQVAPTDRTVEEVLVRVSKLNLLV